ncbi:uncharacterized protein LACBIDRAFT_300399 [Laccaria bicolor S238N-H82]|uniref:Predicted protein n=1 Tax=Laccaria bicolor (strain S238N-H82 / ATCC MYA-4686) TaxID=486041 RepID=B0DGN8_LACBS|nr:uncharacterized protein LACBIDRAFT_300399 [Laccaria bicolor S238N-H82]EDR06187.1 predicted protein [Laccaria bicolor S238N-H82]|eukprot:XP_001883048.1 predicted protein [Laccaria bicolor S238N-H82]
MTHTSPKTQIGTYPTRGRRKVGSRNTRTSKGRAMCVQRTRCSDVRYRYNGEVRQTGGNQSNG